MEQLLSDHTDHFWATLSNRAALNEATVETWFVSPLLEALGHDPLNIVPKVPVLFQEGRNRRQGRKPEADFVVYAEKPFSRATSLIVVESKHPNQSLDNGKVQGESYAHELRAPILLVTNGKHLDVWQLQQTTESECVLSSDVADLMQHRGTLEGLLSPEALRDHCKHLKHKRFDLLSRDLGHYERAAHDRAKRSALQSIERRLLDVDTKREHSSRALLNLGGRGAVVTAASGSGKTVLAGTLLYDAIERRWTNTTQPLPVDVFVPDLARSEKSLEDFITRRVCAHKPGFTVARLQEIARDCGLIVIADGFERIDQFKRSWLEAQLRTFLADYPKALVYITSRAQVAPRALDLPLLALQSYSPDELRDLAELRSRTLDGVYLVFSGAPNYVYRLGEVPLIADLVLNHYATARSYPINLSVLFEGWLEQILATSDLVDRAFDQQLLRSIAVATVDGPINILQACELANNHADPGGTLRRLSEQDAISLRGTTVELQHEALADHLRTTQFWAENPSAELAGLDEMAFDPSSQFALLLVSNAPTADARGAAWETIAQQNLQLAIRSLRFTGFDNEFAGEATETDGRRLASDIQSTVETLIKVHFQALEPALKACLAGHPVERLGVTVRVDEGYVHYQFFDAESAEEPISVVGENELQIAPRMYGHALSKMGFGPEAGRVLAVKLVKEALEELIKERNLIGGRVWTEERTFGRLRHLVRRYETPIDPKRFDQALAYLEPHAGSLVDGNGQTFFVDELLADLRWLQAHKINQLEQWWEDLEHLDLRDGEDQQRFGRTLDAYYRRCQLAYDEVVTQSLPVIRPFLRTLRLMPLRMEIVAEVHERKGYEDISLSRLRWPVQSFEEAGADVTFSDEPLDLHTDEAIQRYAERTDKLLRQFGRYCDDRVICWSQSVVPDLMGYDRSFEKLPDESAIVSGAMKWLKEDLEELFSEVPAGRWQTV